MFSWRNISSSYFSPRFSWSQSIQYH